MTEREPPRPRLLTDSHGNKERARRSNAAERRVASALGGKRIKGSGGRPWSRNDKDTTDRADIRTPKLHVEHKRTERASVSLKREWLEKVSAGARRTDKDPAVVITFETIAQAPSDWLLVPLETARRLLGLEVEE